MLYGIQRYPEDRYRLYGVLDNQLEGWDFTCVTMPSPISPSMQERPK